MKHTNKNQRRNIYFSKGTSEKLGEYCKQKFGERRAISIIVNNAVEAYLKDWKPNKDY